MKVLSSRLIRSPGPGNSRVLPTLREYYERRNRILINREIGGLGDILMHRMMFEDIKKTGVELHFACPTQYHPAVIDHPFVDKVLDCAQVDPYDYQASYNTTTACGRYEMAIAPRSDLHRSDIWSKYCGIDLTNHNMHITLTDEERVYGEQFIDEIGKGKKTVAFCPVSAQMPKNLMGVQITGVLDGLRDFGVVPFGLHSRPIFEVDTKKFPMVTGIGIRQWMSIMKAVDYAITVDTSAFHLAGGMGKPLVGIFSYADGKTYGRYFDFELVQRHRDNGNWDCGPCYNWCACPKSDLNRKPCITEIGSKEILHAFDRLFKKSLK